MRKRFLLAFVLALCCSFYIETRVSVDKTILQGSIGVFVDSKTSLAPFVQRIGGRNWYGFVNARSSGLMVVIETVYDDVHSDVSCGMWRVIKNGKHGAVDDYRGKETVPCIYDSMSEWKEYNGTVIAKVKKGGRAFYINKKNEELSVAPW